MTDPWSYQILKPSFSSVQINSVPSVIYTQSISFTASSSGTPGSGSKCIIIWNNKSKVISKSQVVRILRVLPNDQNTYNALVYYSSIDHVVHTINDKIDIFDVKRQLSKSNSRGVMASGWSDFTGSLQDIINKAEKATKDEIVGEIESLLNPSFS